MTKSACKALPLFNSTCNPFSVLQKAATASWSNNPTFRSLNCWWTTAAISKSTGVITWSAISTTVTCIPSSWRFSAISSPIKPAPTTTAFFTSWRPAHALIRSVSATFRRVKIPSVRIPSQGGSTGSAPGDNTNLSNDSRYVFPVAQSFITTCLFSGSIAFTSDFIRTSILKRALKLSGVCTNKRSLSSITPPI